MAGNRCAPGTPKGPDGSCLPAGTPKVPGCATDVCRAKSLGRRDLLSRVRPVKPDAWKRNPRTWLDTNNIDNVMRQYEAAYPHFKYVATLPVDAFERTRGGGCVSQFCDLDPAALAREGKTLVGMVMNLDRHDQSGSHWVMSAIKYDGVDKPAIYYYDSFGKPPPKPIAAAYRRLLDGQSRAARAHMARNSAYNVTQHQRGNTECGMFSMLALEALLQGKDFPAYCAQRGLDDKVALRTRDRMFSDPE